MVCDMILPMPFFAPLAFLDSIGAPELLLVFVLALVLFGGKGLPNVARGLGRAVREFKRATSGVEDEIKRAMETPVAPSKPRNVASRRAPVRRSSAPAGSVATATSATLAELPPAKEEQASSSASETNRE